MHVGSEYNEFFEIILQLVGSKVSCVTLAYTITVLFILICICNLELRCNASWYMKTLQERLCEQDKLRKLRFVCQLLLQLTTITYNIN